jgi:hypothetical protein
MKAEKTLVARSVIPVSNPAIGYAYSIMVLFCSRK